MIHERAVTYDEVAGKPRASGDDPRWWFIALVIVV